MVPAGLRYGRRRRAAGLLAAALLVAVPVVLVGGPARPAAAEDLASAALRALPLEQQVGQVFMVGAPATGAGAATVAAIRDRHVGNVILTGRSTLGVSATASVTAALQALATPAATGGVRLLVGTDQEGGQVQVLKGTGFSTIPSGLTQGTLTPQALRSQAAAWGSELAAAGVQVDLAPVLDTVPSPAAAATNPPIGVFDREYGFTPATVASHGTAFAQGLADAGIAATGKHFPGLGRVTANTDTTSGVLDTVTTRTDPYLQPFAAAAAAGMPLLMMSTAFYTRIDPLHPAAFSPTVIDGMVRGDMGFTGVVVSDDLGDAVQVSPSPPADRALQFLTAGGDLVLTVDPAVLPAMYDGVLARARADAGFRVRVQQAALRVLELKAAHGLLPTVTPGGDAHSLIGGQVVLGGQRVTSPDGRYVLTLQTDGNVVDYAPGNRPLFSTGTFGQPGDALVMQTDGNLVVYAAAGQVLWSAGTFGHPGAVLREQNDGNAVVYAADGTPLWAGGADHSSLFTGQRLVPGQQLLSPDGRYRLLLQADGDVTVRSPDGRLLFRSGSLGSTVLVLQSDGNLVAYRPDGSAVWDSGTWRDGPSRLDVQNDGNVVLYRADGTPSWATGRDLGQNGTAPSHGTLIPHP